MELNQEYYADSGSTTKGGLQIKYGRSLDKIIPEMKQNGLTRMDPTNIWAINHGCPFIGSGGGAKSLAGIWISLTGLPTDDLAIPYEGLLLSGGDPVQTTGEFQTYSAIRWMYNTRENTSGNNRYGTLSTNTENLDTYECPITGICMKHLIAVPEFVSMKIAHNTNGLPTTKATYEEADAFVPESHIKFDSENYTAYRLNGIKYYYGTPGDRVQVAINPLFETNYNGIHYFAELATAGNSGYGAPIYGTITYLMGGAYLGTYGMYRSWETSSIAHDRYGEFYPDFYTNRSGDPVSSMLVPVWLPAWFSRTLISGYLEGEPNTKSSIIYEPDNASAGLILQYFNRDTAVIPFITPYGAKSILNSLGITWAEDETSAINYDPDAASAGAYSVHIGVMEPGGITLGEGLAGDDIKKATNFGICEITDTPYDGRIPDNPGQNVDPDTGDIPLNTPGVTPFNTFNHMYCMTQSEVNDFASKIWNADETLWEQIVNGLSLYGEMPINAIISLRMYPIDLLKLFDVASTSIMRIGKTAITLDSQTEFVTKQKTAVVNMGSCVFPARYNNFLDYEPYTKAMLYLPYCGTVDVATADVVGKTVQVYYIIDVMTGGCTAVVYFGGIPYFYKNGRVGVEIPITANADSAVTSDALSLVTGGASSLLAAATGNPVAAALSLPSMVNSGLQLAKDSRSSFQTTGTQTPTAAQWTPQNAYFIVQRSVPDEPTGYGHSVGYVTLEGGTLGSFTGYTVMSNPDLTGVDCTEGEKEMIRNLLESGIYC